MDVVLTGQQLKEFRDALMAAFPSYNKLKEVLRFGLNKRLEELVGTGALKRVAFNLIEEAEAEGWLHDLLQAARIQNPKNYKLLNFEQSISLATRGYDKADLEARIRAMDEFLALDTWLPNLVAIEKQVCRIEIDGSTGTGFLVAPNVVLTNYHVVEDVFSKDYNYSDVALRFDYKKLNAKRIDLEGTVYRLDKDWVIAYDDYKTENGLDYALLRLKETPSKRGFIGMPTIDEKFLSHNYREKGPLFIVQHPQGTPLKLALDTESIIRLNDKRTRLFYRTLTEPGSSGSPCFNINWELLALHSNGNLGIENGGIPIFALMEHWHEKGLDWKKHFQST